MYIKWIKVEVPPEKKVLFSKAQESWIELKKLEGFLGQVGGWKQNSKTEACIIAFWKDYKSYQEFMKHYHDGIYERSNQRGTFSRIATSFYESLMMINKSNPTQILNKAKLLRVAECKVNPGKQDHFTRMQEQVWNIGMSGSSGFLGGVFSKEEKIDTDYLVSSFWESKELHHQYIEDKLTPLLEQSQIREDLVKIHGTIVDLNEAWLVMPNHYK